VTNFPPDAAEAAGIDIERRWEAGGGAEETATLPPKPVLSVVAANEVVANANEEAQVRLQPLTAEASWVQVKQNPLRADKEESARCEPTNDLTLCDCQGIEVLKVPDDCQREDNYQKRWAQEHGHPQKQLEKEDRLDDAHFQHLEIVQVEAAPLEMVQVEAAPDPEVRDY